MRGGWQIEGLPDIVLRAGPQAAERTVEFFTAQIRNPHTRAAYAAAVTRFFTWCDAHGPTHVVRTGKTPVLQPAEARRLLDTIDTSTLRGLRDRALLAVMVYSFARVSVVVGMRVEDYYQQGKRWWLRQEGNEQEAVELHGYSTIRTEGLELESGVIERRPGDHCVAVADKVADGVLDHAAGLGRIMTDIHPLPDFQEPDRKPAAKTWRHVSAFFMMLW